MSWIRIWSHVLRHTTYTSNSVLLKSTFIWTFLIISDLASLRKTHFLGTLYNSIQIHYYQKSNSSSTKPSESHRNHPSYAVMQNDGVATRMLALCLLYCETALLFCGWRKRCTGPFNLSTPTLIFLEVPIAWRIEYRLLICSFTWVCTQGYSDEM